MWWYICWEKKKVAKYILTLYKDFLENIRLIQKKKKKEKGKDILQQYNYISEKNI